MSLIRRRVLRSCTVKCLDSARLEVSEVEVVMRRMLCWLGTASLTFMIGVVATLFWLQPQRTATKQEPSAGCAEPANAVRPILAYCELANNAEKYNGQTVRVSVRLSWFTHGLVLFDPNCSGANTQAAVFYDRFNTEEIERALRQAHGSGNWFDAVDIIATGRFKKVTPSGRSDTIYDTASLQFEIIKIEQASKVD